MLGGDMGERWWVVNWSGQERGVERTRSMGTLAELLIMPVRCLRFDRSA